LTDSPPQPLYRLLQKNFCSFVKPSSRLSFLVSYLSTLISDEGSQSISKHASLAQCMKVVASDPDVDWRYLLIESTHSKGFHTWLAQRSWLLPDTKGDMVGLVCFPSDKIVEEEVEDFLKVADKPMALLEKHF
jgi:hypothetical protein